MSGILFRPELIEKVIDGSKMVTRRIATSPTCRLKEGRTYAIQPGRGEHHVGHVTILSVRVERLWNITDDREAADWIREGFATEYEFKDYWTMLHGKWEPQTAVWRIEFVRASNCEDCQWL